MVCVCVDDRTGRLMALEVLYEVVNASSEARTSEFMRVIRMKNKRLHEPNSEQIM
jgi:hypothetical protein